MALWRRRWATWRWTGIDNATNVTMIDGALATQVGDLEVVRTHLAIDKWLVLGGSWGVALGLAYASAYPQRCVRAGGGW